MKMNFEITKDDYINFNLHHLENSKSQKNTFNILRYVIPIIFSILIYFIGTGILNQQSIYWIIVAIIFSIIWILTYPKQYKKLIAKQTDKILSEGDNSSIFGSKSLEIVDGTIVVKGDFTSETVSLESIKDIKVYEDMILIYISGFVAHIIPRRYLDKETEKEFIKELKNS
ncbi:YcxB family protein [Romboutsia maritimum]|uniref:YcxB family protein n=1 Tax=Romboutsia maritimum TaxID=2020948 RepID=A0A371ISJ4_9FIRM|nr:YcxB family protein [Romboutsia maritimum]RDY23460.1 YcxB family protein [Romboutsia maritimum]